MVDFTAFVCAPEAVRLCVPPCIVKVSHFRPLQSALATVILREPPISLIVPWSACSTLPYSASIPSPPKPLTVTFPPYNLKLLAWIPSFTAEVTFIVPVYILMCASLLMPCCLLPATLSVPLPYTSIEPSQRKAALNSLVEPSASELVVPSSRTSFTRTSESTFIAAPVGLVMFAPLRRRSNLLSLLMVSEPSAVVPATTIVRFSVPDRAFTTTSSPLQVTVIPLLDHGFTTPTAPPLV